MGRVTSVSSFLETWRAAASYVASQTRPVKGPLSVLLSLSLVGHLPFDVSAEKTMLKLAKAFYTSYLYI